MDGHTRRAIKKGNDIKKSALDLFNKYGVDKVSVDEIARCAKVSKVTIYKYFESKDGLYKEVVKMVLDEKMKALQNIVSSDIPFLDKLKFLITMKAGSLRYMKGALLYDLIKNDYAIKEYLENNYIGKAKELIISFIEYAKKAGYIDSGPSNETIFLYMDIFRAGLAGEASNIKSAISDRSTFEDLINLYFYGLIKRQ
jgi:AcrR family transcriptional regulator